MSYWDLLPHLFGSKAIHLPSCGAGSVGGCSIVLGKFEAGDGGRAIKVWRGASSEFL